jgi:hypothetical protein
MRLFSILPWLCGKDLEKKYDQATLMRLFSILPWLCGFIHVQQPAGCVLHVCCWDGRSLVELPPQLGFRFKLNLAAIFATRRGDDLPSFGLVLANDDKQVFVTFVVVNPNLDTRLFKIWFTIAAAWKLTHAEPRVAT